MSDSTSEFTKYYEEHKKAIFNYILYRVSFNRDTAEDLTSEIFLKAFEHLDSYDRERPFKTWIFTIAHNHLINYRTSHKQTLSLDEAIDVVKENDSQYAAAVDHKDMMSKILALVSELPESQRDLVIMRYVNDLSNSEIARVTGKEEGAIRTALSRAITSLRDQYNLHHSHPSTSSG